MVKPTNYDLASFELRFVLVNRLATDESMALDTRQMALADRADHTAYLNGDFSGRCKNEHLRGLARRREHLFQSNYAKHARLSGAGLGLDNQVWRPGDQDKTLCACTPPKRVPCLPRPSRPSGIAFN